MKMDAMQKRRMWKVAIAHFVASIGIFYFFMKFAIRSDSFLDVTPSKLETESGFAWLEAWRNIFGAVIALFQPLLWLVIQSGRSVLVFVCSPVIPIWSICFAWLYVKFDNWLNHFPVLGKKVF